MNRAGTGSTNGAKGTSIRVTGGSGSKITAGWGLEQCADDARLTVQRYAKLHARKPRDWRLIGDEKGECVDLVNDWRLTENNPFSSSSK